MLLLVLILVLIAFGLLVVALLSGSVIWAWVSVAVSVAAAVSLLVDWWHRRSAVKAGSETGAATAAPQAVRAPSTPPPGSPPVGRAPADYYEPVTEVLPAVPAPGGPPVSDEPATPEAAVADSTDGADTSSPARGSSVFAAGADSEATTVMPVVQPPGSAGPPSGAVEGDTRTNEPSSHGVTDAPSDGDAPKTPVGGPEEPPTGAPAVSDATSDASVADDAGRRPSGGKVAAGVVGGAVAAGAGLAAAAAAKKSDEKPEPAEPDSALTAAGTGADAPEAAGSPADPARDARRDSLATDAKGAGSDTTVPGSSSADRPSAGTPADEEAATSTASTANRASLGGADLFASFSDGAKGRGTTEGRTPVEESARAADAPAGRPAEDGPAATPEDIDGPTVTTRAAGPEGRTAPSSPSGGQTRLPAGQARADHGPRGQVPPGQVVGQAGQNGPGQNGGQNGPGQGPAGQVPAAQGGPAQEGRGPRGGAQEGHGVHGGAQGGMLPPAGPDGEAPEEPRNAEAAALVAELPDEVLVIDEQPRYHLAGCRSLPGRPVIPIPAREAVELGFTPCGWCTPDRMLARRHSAEVR